MSAILLFIRHTSNHLKTLKHFLWKSLCSFFMVALKAMPPPKNYKWMAFVEKLHKVGKYVSGEAFLPGFKQGAIAAAYALNKKLPWHKSWILNLSIILFIPHFHWRNVF